MQKKKNYKNDSIVSVDMDKVGVMAAHSDPLCVCVVHRIGRHFMYSAYVHTYMSAFINSELHTRTTGQNMQP